MGLRGRCFFVLVFLVELIQGRFRVSFGLFSGNLRLFRGLGGGRGCWGFSFWVGVQGAGFRVGEA